MLTGPCNPLFVTLQKIAGAGHSQRASVEHLGVAHRRSHIFVAEQPLNHAGGLVSLQQMSGTTWPQAGEAESLGMAEAMGGSRFGDSGGLHGSSDRLLGQGWIQVVTPLLPGLGITPGVVLGEPHGQVKRLGPQLLDPGWVPGFAWLPVDGKPLFGGTVSGRRSMRSGDALSLTR